MCHPCYVSLHPVEEEGVEPLLRQVVRALDPSATIDHCVITNMCETVASDLAGTSACFSVLVAALEEQKLKLGDTRNVIQDYLKVLTIVNEMLYDRCIVALLREEPRLRANLQRLRRFSEGSMGSATDENIRILATEIEKVVF